MKTDQKLTVTIKRVKDIFSNIDRNVLKFQKRTGLACAGGCGRCCLSPHVETTALEMYPAAEYLLSKQQANLWYDKAQKAAFDGPCVFYKPDAVDPGKGRCSIYPLRPGVCRLYGFSVFIHKTGRRDLATCSIIKEKDKEKLAKVHNMINNGHEAPVMKEYSNLVYQHNPVLGSRQMPINAAFKSAMQNVSLRLKYTNATSRTDKIFLLRMFEKFGKVIKVARKKVKNIT